ncbi:hypothetical protein B0G81_8106 [Paraburkholderia sp. BL6665CI2N2]|nr:hypothetical protein B0G81_8106 [Paraburkholderia sp. BL6665CI2N2]
MRKLKNDFMYSKRNRVLTEIIHRVATDNVVHEQLSVLDEFASTTPDWRPFIRCDVPDEPIQ